MPLGLVHRSRTTRLRERHSMGYTPQNIDATNDFTSAVAGFLTT